MARKPAVKKKATRKKAAGKRPARNSAAYITSLEVENIRCFGPRQRLDLTDKSGNPARWTIILGPNSGGKTTLLQAIAGLSFRVPLQPISKDSTQESIHQELGLQIQYELSRNFLRSSSKSSGNIEGSFVLGNDLVDAKSSSKQTGERQIRLSKQIPSIRRSSLNPTMRVLTLGFGTSRRPASRLPSSRRRDDHSLLSLFHSGVELRDAEDWLLNLDYLALRKSKRKNRLMQASDTLIDMLPDVSHIRFSDSKDKVSVQFRTPDGWLQLDQLGHGYQTLITWVVDLASRMFDEYPDAENPLAEPAVVLVDEIDLHMHPEWQRKIMGYLSERFPNVQFIATAHSPLIVQAADERTNIAVLKREGDHVVIENDPEFVQNWRIDQILTSDLFGLKTARPLAVEEILDERRKLLSRKRQTPKIRKRLAELDELIGFLPGNETAEDREAWEIIHRAAAKLQKRDAAE